MILLSRRKSLTALLTGAASISMVSGGRSAPVPSAGGLVVLTVGGLVGAPNRGQFDAARDRFFDHHNLSFEKARTFGLTDLLAFPQQEVTAADGGSAIGYKGPLLEDVLTAASPMPGAKTVRFFALDGYAAEIALTDSRMQRWILAMETGGKPFGIGDFGPLYAMR